MNTGDHVELCGRYPGLRVAVIYEDDPGWTHERLMLWVVEPDRFVVLTPDGDMYEEMRETCRNAQIVTGRRRVPNGPANVVAFGEPMEDAEMLRHITEGRLEGERIYAAESLTSGAGPTSYFNWSGEAKALSTPGAVARVNHRLRGRRATVREEIFPVVGLGDVLHEDLLLEEFEPSGNGGMDFAPGAVDLCPRDGNVWLVCDPEHPDFGKSMDLQGMSYASGDNGLEDRTKGNFSVVKRCPLSRLCCRIPPTASKS